MDIQTVNKEKMEALESLAKTNLLVSEVKATLANLKIDEEKYLAKRETKALARIEFILEESKKISEDAYKNYNDIHNLSKSSSEYVIFLTEVYDDFLKLQEVFEKKTEAWEENIEIIEKNLEDIKRNIKVDKIQLKNDQDSINTRNKEIALEKRKLRDERGTLERTIIRLKNK